MSLYALTIISLFGLYIVFGVAFMIAWRVKGKGEFHDILIEGSSLTIKKEIMPRINVLGQRLILFSMAISVIWFTIYESQFEYQWLAYAVGVLIPSFMIGWALIQFIRDGDVHISVDVEKVITMNNVPIERGAEIKFSIKKQVSSQGGISFDLIMHANKKKFLILDGVDEFDADNTRGIILFFIKTHASHNPKSE